MYRPNSAVRVEVDLHAYNDLAEWRVIRDGQQRGGIAIAHGCWWPTPEDCDAAIDAVVREIREQLFGIIADIYPIQLSFE